MFLNKIGVEGKPKTLVAYIYIGIVCLNPIVWWGCQVQAHYTFSAPRLAANSNIKVEAGKFYFGDIDLWLLAWNRRGSGLMILPIPMPVDVNDDFKPPFRLTVQLEPHQSGFHFDPARTFLWKSKTERVVPSRILGGSYIKANTLVSTIPPSDHRVFKLEKDSKTILNLAFDIVPPEPDESFVLDIEGISLNDKPYILPRIHFQKESWSGTLR